MEKYFGKNLKNLRHEHGLTQPKLAQIVGTSQQSISYFESEVKIPNIDTAGRIAEVLDTTIDALMNTPPEILLAEQVERRRNP